MAVLGVDPSTKTFTAVLLDWNESLIDWWHFGMEGQKSLDRMREAHHAAGKIPWEKAEIICFERPAGAGSQAVMDIWRAVGACFIYISESQEVWEMGPTEWKKKVGLPGNASKEEIGDFFWTTARTQALAAMDPIRTPQDFYDAYCVGLAAVRENRKGL